MINVWLLWTLVLIVVWLVVYVRLPLDQRRKMLKVSFVTSLLGLTEPLFVPEYWNPPSLFDLAARTGFDVESLIFSFGVGGLVVVLYDYFFSVRGVAMAVCERHSSRHRMHYVALAAGPILFVAFLLVPGLSPIYAAALAMTIGAFAVWCCRPDLMRKMITSAFLFMMFYFGYFLVLIMLDARFVDQVWNSSAISGWRVFGVPAEELLFAFTFGLYWSSVYEHAAWRKLIRV